MRVILGHTIYTAVCLMAFGCHAPSITVQYPDGRMIQVEGVPGQAHPATLINDNLEVSTGGVDQALAHLSSSANWLAVGLIVIGLGSIILSAWIPMMPRSMSIMCMGAGGVIWAFPVLLDRYSAIVMVVIALIAGLWLFGLWDNRKKLKWQP